MFEHADYAGVCSVVGVGSYGFPEDIHFANDTASSIAVGPGVRALACSDRALDGECVYLASSLPALDGTAIGNDTLSSLRVERVPADCSPGAGQIALFEHAGFAGACSVLGIGDFSRSVDLGLGNDTASSVVVGPDTQALLCRDDGFGEPCDRVTGSVADLSALRIGNDAVSSVRVLPGTADCVVRGANAKLAPYVAAIAATCAREYPKVVARLQTNAVNSPPLVVDLTRLETFTGEAIGRDIRIDEERWDPSDLGILDHELTHLVTRYPDAPLWITEGVADFVRGELTSWDNYHCRGDETYAAGYGCAAALLRYADQHTGESVPALQARLRTQSFDGEIGGTPVDELWAACREDGACQPR